MAQHGARHLLRHRQRGRVVRHAAARLIKGLSRRFGQIAKVRTVLQTLGDRVAPVEVFGALPSGDRPLVLIVSHDMTPSGAPKLAWAAAAACKARGWAVIVISPADGSFRDAFISAGATVVISPDALSPYSLTNGLGRHADVVLLNTITCAPLMRRPWATPTAWFIHESHLIGLFAAQGTDLVRLLGRADKVWALSSVTDRLLRPYSDSVEIIGGTVARVRADPPTVRSPAKLLVLGGLEPRKGQFNLARAMLALTEEERSRLQVDLYGRELDHDYAALVASLTAELPMLRLAGSCTPDEAVALIAEADGVIIPSLDESLSLVALEAMSAGRLVICTRACGVASALEDGRSAFVGDDPTPSTLADTLRRALEARGRWPQIGAAGQTVFEQEFSPEVYAARVTNGLAKLMGLASQ